MSQTDPGNVVTKKSDPTLRDLLVPFFRRKKMFTLTFCGLLLGSALAAFFLSSQHEARMEILVDNRGRVDPKVSSDSSMPAPAAVPPVTDEQINAEVELLQSPDLLQEVVIANGLQDIEKKSWVSRIEPKKDDAWYTAKATYHLGKKLKIDVVSKTNMIEVSYKASDPQLAYGVVQKLASAYLAKHLAVHRPQGSYSLFASETEKYRQALADSESRLVDFGKTSGVAAPDLEKSEMAQEVVNAVGALHNAEQAIAADKNRIADIETRMKGAPDRISTQQVTAPAQTLLQTLQADLLTSELKKTLLLLKYDPSYPLVVEAQREVDQTEAAIADATKQQFVSQSTDHDPTYELMREDAAKTKADLAAQQAVAVALNHSIQDMQQQMVNLDGTATTQADLIREVKANEGNYLLYLSKREQERISDALDQKVIGNVAIAVPPVLPILPAISPVLVMVIGIVLSGFLAAGATCVAEYLNPSLRTPSEVLEVLRIPVLAAVPKQTA